MSERIMKVLANVAQGLTEEEKLQARTNIGAIGGVKVADSSGTTELVPDENGKVTVDLTNVGNVPSFSGSDNGLVLGVVGSSDPELQWVSKGGGGTSYTAGDGIDIDANDVISAKVDGTSIGVNASGELESLATVDQHYNASSTNAQSGTAVAEAVSGVSGVPSVGSGDDGKVLTADFTGGSGTFSWQDPPAQEQADWAQTNTSAVDFIKNKPSIPSKTSDLTNDSGFITAADEAVKDVTQNGSSVVNAQGVAEIVTRDVPSSTSSDSGKVLTVDSSGSPVWVTPSGGQSYTAGNGIDITNDVISAKLDGTTLTNGSSGLSVTNPVPDTTGASQGDVLSVGSSGLEWVTPGGGGGSDIFLATYGTTTFSEISSASEGGKAVFLYNAGGFGLQGYILPLCGCFRSNDPASSYAYFANISRNTPSYSLNVYGVYSVNGNNSWTRSWVYPCPNPSAGDVNKVLTCIGNGKVEWVTPSGGSSYSAGSGINIANDTISAKVDGSSITVNSSGELQATASSLQTKPLVAGPGITLTASDSDVTISADSQLPSYSSADSGKSLVVNGNGDGVEWDNRIGGNLVVSDGQGRTTSQDLQTLRINLSGGMDGLVRVRPVGGSIAIAGWLVPGTDGRTEAGCYPTPYIGSTSSPGIRWRKDPMDIEQLTKVTCTYGTSTTQELSITAGNWYEVTITNNAVVRIALETSSTDTVHTIIVVKGDSAASTAWANIDYFTEMSTARYIACDLSSTSADVTARVFDVYIKGGFKVENIPRSFCRVRELEPSTFHS